MLQLEKKRISVYQELIDLVDYFMYLPNVKYDQNTEELQEINDKIRKVKARLVLFRPDNEFKEFDNLLKTGKLSGKTLSEFIINLRKEFVPNTKISKDNLKTIRVKSLEIENKSANITKDWKIFFIKPL